MNLDAWADEYGDSWQLLNDDQKDRILAQEIAEWDEFMTYARLSDLDGNYEMGVDMAAPEFRHVKYGLWWRDGF